MNKYLEKIAAISTRKPASFVELEPGVKYNLNTHQVAIGESTVQSMRNEDRKKKTGIMSGVGAVLGAGAGAGIGYSTAEDELKRRIHNSKIKLINRNPYSKGMRRVDKFHKKTSPILAKAKKIRAIKHGAIGALAGAAYLGAVTHFDPAWKERDKNHYSELAYDKHKKAINEIEGWD